MMVAVGRIRSHGMCLDCESPSPLALFSRGARKVKVLGFPPVFARVLKDGGPGEGA